MSEHRPERDHCRKALVTLGSNSRRDSRMGPERDHCRKALVTGFPPRWNPPTSICPERDHCRKALVTRTSRPQVYDFVLRSRKGSLPKGIGDCVVSILLFPGDTNSPERDHCRKALVTSSQAGCIILRESCPERDHCRKALVT